MSRPEHEPDVTGGYELSEAVRCALARYRRALAAVAPGAPPPDMAAFTEGLDEAERERFHLEAASARRLPTATFDPDPDGEFGRDTRTFFHQPGPDGGEPGWG